MEWYWWAVIAAGVALIGVLKIKVWNNMKKSRALKRRDIEDSDE